MKLTFRWYGEGDVIPLRYIRQIPKMHGVVTAVYDVPVGEVWDEERIANLKWLCDKEELSMDVIESVPVHEDIKLGKPTRDKLIENYKETLRNLAKFGVKVVCYNFMPVFDWLRTDLYYEHPDGSTSLAYNHETLLKLDKYNLHLPGWDESYTNQELTSLLREYENVSHEQLFDNLCYFLNGIMPVCEETGISMAIHPDDPPWDMFGLPRIITGMESYDKLVAAVPSPRNGFTFCTGSLGAGKYQDLPEMARKYASRIFFAHLRQVKHTTPHDFYEIGHQTHQGDVDMFAIVKNLVDNGFDGYVRPDHGRNIFGEQATPGYGLYDRALGAAYLCGLFEAVEKTR